MRQNPTWSSLAVAICFSLAALAPAVHAAELTPQPASVVDVDSAEAPDRAMLLLGTLDPARVQKVEDRRALVAFDVPGDGLAEGEYALTFRVLSKNELQLVDLNLRGKQARGSSESWHHEFDLAAGAWRDVTIPLRVTADDAGDRWHGAMLLRFQFRKSAAAVPIELVIADLRIRPVGGDLLCWIST
ncbi:MAG: hypothetical protein AAF823_05885 [Planctomycetota bacterium]